MPIGAVTMILTNVGLQIYNNWCGSRQNKQLQQKREEFERAAKERNTQRMWQIMHEGQELTRQLEEEKHQQRLEELKNDVGNLLQKLTYAATIDNWPLNVLPIVMKNQALGNLLANQEESVALHCIFTPSNSLEFNRVVFPRIEEALETYCNQHWSVMSDHPILFYSGTWKSQQSPTEVQIDSMRAALSNLPTLVITPFFRPNDSKLVFHVRIWGVGASSSDEFSIPEIEPTEFQRNYQTGDDYVNDADLMDELIEDLVPYLQCLIGYMTDTYFWSSLGKAPYLPLLVTNGTINTDGMKYLVDDSRDYYDKLLLTNEDNTKENPFMQDYILNLFEGSSVLWDADAKDKKLEDILLKFCTKKLGKAITSMEMAKKELPFLKCENADIDFLTEISRKINSNDKQKAIKEIINELLNKNPHVKMCFTASQKELQIRIKESNTNKKQYFVFEIISPNIIIGTYCDSVESIATYSCLVFFCIDSMGIDSGVFMSDVRLFKAVRITTDAFSKLIIDKEALKKLFSEKVDDFGKYIRLYEELNNKTDIEALRHQENLYLARNDLTRWIQSNALNSFTGISLFKGYSVKHKKYLLFGVYREDSTLQLSKNVLVSYYDALPSEIDSLFLYNTHYSLNFN